MIIKTCSYCKKEFEFRNAPSDKGIVCSKTCNFKKMNKRMDKVCIVCNKSFKVHKYRFDIAKTCSYNCRNQLYTTLKGDKTNSWKGDGAKYAAVHSWLRTNIEKATKCEWCGIEGKIEWANISHEYKRDLSDWAQLCHKCNLTYDYRTAWGEATRRINAGL